MAKAIIKSTGKIVTTYRQTSDTNQGKSVVRILEDADAVFNERELDFIGDEWEFIEQYLPDYSQNEDVAMSDDIQCCLDAEANADKLQRVIEQCGPTPEDWQREQLRIDSQLLNAACDNYFKQVYGRERSK